MDDRRNLFYPGATLRTLLEIHDLSNQAIVKEQISKEDKEGSGSEEFDPAAAFLGPNLWDKTLPDFKLEYTDLDEFLNDQNTNKVNSNVQKPQPTSLPSVELSPISSHSSHEELSQNDNSMTTSPDSSDQSSSEVSQENKQTVPISFDLNPGDLALATVPGREHFDPINHTFSEDELRPQAMVKKSRKQFVPDTMKDDKYWARRSKNNQAAKRSREARRVKENQIVLRASYLEKENIALKNEVTRLKEDNEKLRQGLNKYEA